MARRATKAGAQASRKASGGIDISKMALEDLREHCTDVQGRIQKLQREKRSEVKKQIRELAASIGETVESLFGFGEQKKPPKTTVKPKYQDPESGKTWSGRGRTPKWLQEAEKAGKSRDDFLMEQ